MEYVFQAVYLFFMGLFQILPGNDWEGSSYIHLYIQYYIGKEHIKQQYSRHHDKRCDI